MKNLIRFNEDNDGVTAIEYCFIAALIAIVIFSAVTTIGENVRSQFSEIAIAFNGGAG
jgi:Flp pilus assembly pilin Flp